MAERKEDLRGFLDSRLRDVEQKIRDIEQQNLVNFRWIIGICLLIFCSLIASIFSLNTRVSTLQAGLERVSVQVNLMAQSFSYKLKTNKSATVEEQKKTVVIEEPSTDQRPKTVKLIN